MANTLITIVECWADPRATEDPHFRQKLLCDYLYTNQKDASHDLAKAIKRFPTMGWSIDFRLATDSPQIAF